MNWENYGIYAENLQLPLESEMTYRHAQEMSTGAVQREKEAALGVLHAVVFAVGLSVKRRRFAFKVLQPEDVNLRLLPLIHAHNQNSMLFRH